MSPQKRIAIYARVSSDQQAQDGTIESQLAAVNKFAIENGLKIDPDLIFADNGISGVTLARQNSTLCVIKPLSARSILF